MRNRLDDVKLVQDVLNQIVPVAGGPVEKLIVDGICGANTRAAIKRFQAQAMAVAFPDVIVDPGGATIYRMNELAYPAVDDGFRARCNGQIAAADRLIMAGLTLVQFEMSRGPLPNPLFGDSRGQRLLNDHFKLDKAPDRGAALHDIAAVLFDMHLVAAYQPHGPGLKPAFGFLDIGISGQDKIIPYGFAFSGGARMLGQKTRKGLRMDYVYLTRLVLNLRDVAISYVICHELAHFTGPRRSQGGIIDHAYHHSQRGLYAAMSPEKAMHNADSYAQFCWEVSYGSNFVP